MISRRSPMFPRDIFVAALTLNIGLPESCLLDPEIILQSGFWNVLTNNSSQLPSKKHHVKGQVKYGLTDTMDNLYTKFKSECTSIRMHRSTFFAARPSYIKLVQWTNRNQCLCQVCANMSLLINRSKVLPKSGKLVAGMLDEDIEAKLEVMEPKITVNMVKQWRKVDVDFKGKKIKKDQADRCQLVKTSLYMHIPEAATWIQETLRTGGSTICTNSSSKTTDKTNDGSDGTVRLRRKLEVWLSKRN